MMTFAEFYRQKRRDPHGDQREPFPWMVRLAEWFAVDDLPGVIDLPTGCAKTEIVVIWAWGQRYYPHVPRRLWIASDRRVIVDQAYEVAEKVLGGDVRVSRLRGGIVLDDEPILDPVQPQIISSTIDQLGSRLLYRAYGASQGSWPIWAGLAGNDSLIVLDEAHLSPTAEDTMRACKAMGADIRVIAMTATPRGSGLRVFTLDNTDHAHPELHRRLEARRIVQLRQAKRPAPALAAAGQELLDAGCRRVAVVCNTVRQAREVFAAAKHTDKYLIIGRQRPLDRDRIMADLLPRVRSDRGIEAGPLLVVTTQCIEAGADLDFDGMVSEVCPIDALRQRLGRLDRLGKAGNSRCILITPDPLDGEIVPYGTAPRETWRWLAKHAKRHEIDLGPKSWATLAEFVPDAARSSRPEPISFLEPHLRMLARTSPRPRVEPDIDLLLHGSDRAPGDVAVAWRGDVNPDVPDAANEILRLVPPTALEACPVPLWELRAWLDGRTLDTDAGDVEGAKVPEANHAKGSRCVLRWDGQDDGAARVFSCRLKPGDVVVLPAAWGGYDEFGWAPLSLAPVPDLAEDAFLRRTGRTLQRFSDPDADVTGDRIHRWSGGVVVETFTEQRCSRAVPREVALAQHARSVAERARADAAVLGLDENSLHLAGVHHDDGKADPDWQLNVNGGDLRRLGEAPLAKGRYRRSMLSTLPPGWRHEALSLTLLPPGTGDLARWLVATHHGHARPFWPIPEHGLGLAELMDRLQTKHGYWRLALHEAVLRCADRAVSREEEMGNA